jgi:hypothetical protein
VEEAPIIRCPVYIRGGQAAPVRWQGDGPLEVAQIFNLPFRRFETCIGDRISRERPGIPPGAD